MMRRKRVFLGGGMSLFAAAGLMLGMASLGADDGVPKSSVPATPFDLLATPSPPTPRFAQSLLVDIVRTDNRLVAVGTHGNVVYSDDDGKSWTKADVPTMVSLNRVAFPEANRGWAVGHDGIMLLSRDGGKTWTRQLDGNTINAQLLEWSQSFLKTAQSAAERKKDDPAAKATLDRALDLNGVVQSGLKYGPARPLLSLWFKNEREGWAIGAYGMALQTVDGGTTWKLASPRIPNEESLHLYAMTSTAAGTLLIVGEQGYVYRSSDNGEHWERSPSLFKGSLFGVVAASKAGRDVAIAFGLNGKVFRSTDDGRTWTAVKVSTSASLWVGLVLKDGEIVIAGNDETLLRSADGGETLSVITGTRGKAYYGMALNSQGRLVAVGQRGVSVAPVEQAPERSRQ